MNMPVLYCTDCNRTDLSDVECQRSAKEASECKWCSYPYQAKEDEGIIKTQCFDDKGASV